MPPPAYRFRAVTPTDLPLLREWLLREHVREWWGDPVRGLARIAEHIVDPAINPFMVECDDVPIGYIFKAGTLTRKPIIPAAISGSERAVSISSSANPN